MAPCLMSELAEAQEASMTEGEERRHCTVELEEEEGDVGPGQEPRVSDIRPKCALCLLPNMRLVEAWNCLD